MARVATGQMRSKAQFVSNVPVPAGAGFKDVYVSLFTTWGHLRKKSGGRRLESGEIIIESSHEYTTRFANVLDAGLNNQVKAIIDGKTYTINDYWQEDEKNFYYKFNLNKSEDQITVSSSGGGETIPMEIGSVAIAANTTALEAHAYPENYVLLNGASQAVDYTINPVTHNEKTFIITCVSNAFRVRVLPASGTINGTTEYEMVAWEGRSFYCTGGNIIVT